MKELELRSVTDHQRRLALDEFHALLEHTCTEEVWQDYFDTHPFVLVETLPARMTRLFSKVQLSSGEADYVFMGPTGNLFGDYGVIELKRPDHPIVSAYSSQHIMPSSKLIKAYYQSQRYLDSLRRPNSAELGDHFVIGNRAHAFIIIGRTEKVLHRCSSDAHRAQLGGLLPSGAHVFAYDELCELYAGQLGTRVQVLVVSDNAISPGLSEALKTFRGIEIDEDGYLEGSAIATGGAGPR